MELVIRAKDNTHTDPVKDQRGSYRRGDIVEVGPVGWDWGRMVVGPGHPFASLYQQGGPYYNGTEPKAPIAGSGCVIVRILRSDGVTPIWKMTPFPINFLGAKPHYPPKLRSYMDREYNILDEPIRRRLWHIVLANLPVIVLQQLRDTGYYEVKWVALRNFVRNKKTQLTELNVGEGALV